MKNETSNINPNAFVRDLMVPAHDTVNSAGTVKEALDEMASEGIETSPVADAQTQFVGTITESELNRKVGGKGHDPAKEPVTRQLDKESIYCFEDDTIVAARQRMQSANVDELPVLSRTFALLGTVHLAAIEAAPKTSES